MHVAMIDPSLFTLPYDRELIRGLEQAGHQATLFGRKLQPDDGDAGGVPIATQFYRLSGSRAAIALPPKVRLFAKGVEHPIDMVRLLRRLKRSEPEVIHFQWLPLPLIDGRLLAAFRRIAPLVLTVHDTNPFNGNPSARLQAAGFLSCLKMFDRLIVHTDQGHARLSRQGIAPDRLGIVPHGTIGTAPASGAPDSMRGPLSFLLFGKIKPYKGADLLIEAFASLPLHLRQQANVRIVGKPYMDLKPMLDRIKELRLEHQISIVPSFVADAQVPVLFHAGTVAVFPYREIDASGVLAQVLAHGRPVVASKLGLFAQMLIDGVHGHLVPPEDVNALAASFTHLIADREFAAECSLHAAALASEAPTWREIALRTVEVYRATGDDRRCRATATGVVRRRTGGKLLSDTAAP